MAVRLAWGVIADRDRGAWMVDTGERVEDHGQEALAGAAVVLGDKNSPAAAVLAARESLAELIGTGGITVAGAGIDLGAGFVSARLAGTGGDRRDAVLAALRILGMDDARRIGERTATLVALFGVTATKPVGAEAERAIAEGRWAALTLASAAADLLGPEQLVQVLGWEIPEGIDPIPTGAPSALALNLRRVLESYSRPRRLELLADLWEQVCTRQASARTLRLLLDSQDLTVEDGLHRRYRQHLEAESVDLVTGSRERELSLLDALHYIPDWNWFWRQRLEWMIQDAIAATVLLRTAVAVQELGVHDGITLLRDQIGTAASLPTKSELIRAKRKRPDISKLPARPACHLREIDAWLRRHQPMDAAFERFVRARTAHALAYGLVIDQACADLVGSHIAVDILPEDWDSESLRTWRNAFGNTETRLPSDWWQIPLVRNRDADSLAARLAKWAESVDARTTTQVLIPAPIDPTPPAEPATRNGVTTPADPDPDAEPVARDEPGVQDESDTPGMWSDDRPREVGADLLWYGDLADAILRMRGQARAEIGWGYLVPYFETDPTVPQPDPLTPRPDSIPLAVAGAAQLVSLGAIAPARCREWTRLCAGLMTSGSVAAALSNEFEVAETVLVHDGSTLPETTARIQIARNAARLAEWSDYMGNCIAGPWYQDQAVRGLSILVALRDEQDTIQVNAELRANRSGWLVSEIYGRFNSEADPALGRALRRWVLGLRRTEPEPAEVTPDAPVRPRRAKPNPFLELAPVLREAVRAVFDAAPETLRALTAVAGSPEADPKALTAMRRSPAARLNQLCAEALDADRVSLPDLWSAVNNRPLATALANLDPVLAAKYPRLQTLTADAQLPSKRLRELVKAPELAQARSMDLIALRLRKALVEMAMADAPTFAAALARRPSWDLICTFAIAITSSPDHSYPVTAISDPKSTKVTGFPATSLTDPDGPWQPRLSAAVEFGGGIEQFWERAAESGVLISLSWLKGGTWQALWARAWAPATR
ncbi:hypothetical protein ACFVUS_01240 [Nocardia sp. NPDC058058]|uniref:hypothetical protein n=1 Tax=Nocardia sp. NPDC058058 TaxID=3346317 RepID=UPI0036D9001E